MHEGGRHGGHPCRPLVSVCAPRDGRSVGRGGVIRGRGSHRPRGVTVRTTRITTATAAVAALASAGVATAAEAPVISAQKVLAGKTAPLTIPGTGVKKGA